MAWADEGDGAGTSGSHGATSQGATSSAAANDPSAGQVRKRTSGAPAHRFSRATSLGRQSSSKHDAQTEDRTPDSGRRRAPKAPSVTTSLNSAPTESADTTLGAARHELMSSRHVTRVSSRPSTTNAPVKPIDSPLGLALAAMGTRSRPLPQAVAAVTASPPVAAPPPPSPGMETEQSFAAKSMVAMVNSPPSVPKQPVGKANAVTGVVTGTVVASDPDNDALTFTVSGNPAGGTVTLNPQSGSYSYSPTTAARLAATRTQSADTDLFTVAVSDGQTTIPVPVTVEIAPIRLQNHASIAVGSNPSAAVVSPDGKRLYIANAGSKTITVIDTATGKKIDASPRNFFSTTISVGSSPGALALSADGTRLYVANTGSGTVSVIDTATYARIDADPSSSSSKDIKVGSSPSALALGSDGRLYVANRGGNNVSVIDTATNTEVDTNSNTSGTQSISVGLSPNALALGSDGKLYVANTGSGTVSVINTGNYTVANTFTVDGGPTGITLGSDGRLYVANTGSGTVSVINTVTNAVIDVNPNVSGNQSISVGPAPTSVVLSHDGALVYVANGNDTVSVISTKDYSVVAALAIDSDSSGGHAVAITPSGTVYVTDAVDKRVRVLVLSAAPATTLKLLSGSVTVTGDATPRPLITADGTRAVIVTPVTGATTATTRVAVMDVATGKQVGSTLTLTGGAPSTTLSSDGTRAIVTIADPNTNSTRVTVISTATGKQIGATTSGPGSSAGVQLLSADANRYQVITESGPQSQSTLVRIIDTTTGAETGAVLVTGLLMTAQQLGAEGSRVLVTTQSYDSIYDSTTAVTRSVVIDAVNGTQLGTTVELSGFPAGLTVSADGKHALITSEVARPYDWNAETTYIAMMDTTTGTQTGVTVRGSGEGGVTAQFSADSSRALFTSFDSTTNKSRISVVDTGSGAEKAAAITIAGQTTDVFVSPDGLRAAIVTLRAVAVVNVLSGTQIGITQTPVGQPSNSSYFSQFTDDGTRLVLATPVYNMSSPTSDTRIAVLNMVDGTLMRSTIIPGSFATGTPLLPADSTRALIVTDVFDAVKRTYSTRVAVFDTATGAQVGSTLTMPGRVGYRPILLSEDGTHAVLAYTQGSTTHVVVVDAVTGAQKSNISVSGVIAADPVLTPDGTHLLVTTTTKATLTSRTTRVSVLAVS